MIFRGSCCLLVHLLISTTYVPTANFPSSISPKNLAIFRTVNRTFAELATTTSVLITMAYWLLLGGDEKEEIKYGFMNVHEHVMNTCISCVSKGLRYVNPCGVPWANTLFLFFSSECALPFFQEKERKSEFTFWDTAPDYSIGPRTG